MTTAPAAAPILLVEDDPLSLKLMAAALEAQGFTVDRLSNGNDVGPHVATQRPALVVVDVGLPGIDGMEVTRRLRADSATRRIPVLAVTAYVMQHEEQQMREAGCDAFLPKPIRLAGFVEVVKQLIAGDAAS